MLIDFDSGPMYKLEETFNDSISRGEINLKDDWSWMDILKWAGIGIGMLISIMILYLVIQWYCVQTRSFLNDTNWNSWIASGTCLQPCGRTEPIPFKEMEKVNGKA